MKLAILLKNMKKEADQFAKDVLIPPKDYELFITRTSFSEQKIRDFANSIKIHPGIVGWEDYKGRISPVCALK